MVNKLPPLAGPVDASGEPDGFRERLEMLLNEANHDAQMWGIEHHDQARKVADMARCRTLREVLALLPAAAVPSSPAQEHWHRFKYQIALRAMVCRCGFRINDDRWLNREK